MIFFGAHRLFFEFSAFPLHAHPDQDRERAYIGAKNFRSAH